MPAFAHFYGLRPAEFWGLKLREFELMKGYLEAWEKAQQPVRR